jgi:hypothetical protein
MLILSRIGKWPKDLVKGIYPNEPTVAVGVEACLENVNEATLRTQIENAIMAGLKVRYHLPYPFVKILWYEP